jgi:hypothetical protein
MRNTVTIPIRTVEAIDAEIAQLENDVECRLQAVSYQEARISSDEFDGGRVELRNMPRESRNGRFASRTATLNASTAITAARHELQELRDQRIAVKHQIAELRAERRLWTDLHPMGMLEIAAMLGYSDAAARQWKRRNVLPAPSGSVSGTPYWWRRNVLVWALAHGKTRAIVSFDPTEYGSDYLEETA